MNKKLKCYISSPSGIDLTPIHEILDNLNIEYHNFYDLSIGTSFADLIKKKLRESDFVIAVINDKNYNVIYEIGVAEGLNKPIFLLVNKETKVPFYLEGKIYFQIDWNKDTKLIELSLKNYIEDIATKSRQYKKKSAVKNIVDLTIDDTNEILMQLKKLRESNNENQLVRLITDTFKKLNIQAVSELPTEDKSRVDIAIINENLSNYFGNPLLIEVKTGNITSDKIDQAELQLQRHINNTDASTGILLYFDKQGKRFEYGNKINPFILRFDIEDFIHGIASEGFDNFLIKARNELVHGKFK